LLHFRGHECSWRAEVDVDCNAVFSFFSSRPQVAFAFFAWCCGGLLSIFVRASGAHAPAAIFVLESGMPEGKIKKLVTDKGFGFIEGDRGDMFFHHSTVEGVTFEDLREGQMVEYEVGKGPKGPRAEHVRLLD
jgi:CspA family cold shock protein